MAHPANLVDSPVHSALPQRAQAEHAPLYPSILQGSPAAAPTAPALIAPRRRAGSQGSPAPATDGFPEYPALQPKRSGSAGNVQLVGTHRQDLPMAPAHHPSAAPHTALSLAATQSATSTASRMLPLSVFALVSDPANASNSSNSSASLVFPARAEPPAQTGQGATSRRHASPRQKRRERALLAATSLFLLSRDSLKQAWLRHADIHDLGRNLVKARSANPVLAQQEFDHRKECTKMFLQLAQESATGKKLLSCLRTVARESRDGDGKFLPPNPADIKGKREGDKSSLQDMLLTARARRMVEVIHAQFCQDPLSPSLIVALRTCDHLLVHWYRESISQLRTPHERPEPAFLGMARRNMMVNVLVTYGLMKLAPDVEASHAAKNMNAVMAAAIRRLNASPRFASLLRRMEAGMSSELQAFLRQCERQQIAYERMVTVLESLAVDPRRHSNIWRWLNRVQTELVVPEVMRPYFERAALASGKLTIFSGSLKDLGSSAVDQWNIAATDAMIRNIQSGKLRLTVIEQATLLIVERALFLDDKQLRLMMVGFE